MNEFRTEKEPGAASPARWRVTTRTGDSFACRVDVIGPRVEVRLTTGADTLLCARELPSLNAANIIAHGWLRAIVSGDNVDMVIDAARRLAVH